MIDILAIYDYWSDREYDAVTESPEPPEPPESEELDIEYVNWLLATIERDGSLVGTVIA